MDIAPRLNLHILSIGSDGSLADQRLQLIDTRFDLIFSYPILPSVGPVLRVQDPKHAKKTARNAIISGARLLTFGKSSVRYDHLLSLVNQPNSIIYKNDVIKLDKQDDAAAYQTFCSANLMQCLTHEFQVKEGMEGFAIYLFIMGM